MSNNVFIVGGSTRAVAQSVERFRQVSKAGEFDLDGGQVYSSDLFGDFDTAQIAEFIPLPENGEAEQGTDKAESILKSHPELSDAWTLYTGAVENRWGLVRVLEDRTRLLGTSAESLKRLSNKIELFHSLRAAGFYSPNWCQPHELNAFISDIGPSNILGKKFRSFGGIQVQALDELELKAPADFDWYQQRIGGNDLSASFVRRPGNKSSSVQWLGTCRPLVGDKRFHSKGFKYTGSITVSDLPDSICEQVQRLGDFVGNEYDLVGLFNLDLKVEHGKVYFLEVNPRISASMELFERQGLFNLFALQLWSCSESLRSACPWIRESATGTQHFGKAIWYADRRIEVVDGFPEFAMTQKNAAGFPLIGDIPMAGQVIDVDAPVFTVFAESESKDGVAENLLKTAKMFDSKINSFEPGQF